jgi:hypothetical protein
MTFWMVATWLGAVWPLLWTMILINIGVSSDSVQFPLPTAVLLTIVTLGSPFPSIFAANRYVQVVPEHHWSKILTLILCLPAVICIPFLLLALFALWFWNTPLVHTSRGAWRNVGISPLIQPARNNLVREAMRRHYLQMIRQNHIDRIIRDQPHGPDRNHRAPGFAPIRPSTIEP